jgi:hypothetical protein
MSERERRGARPGIGQTMMTMIAWSERERDHPRTMKRREVKRRREREGVREIGPGSSMFCHATHMETLRYTHSHVKIKTPEK